MNASACIFVLVLTIGHNLVSPLLRLNSRRSDPDTGLNIIELLTKYNYSSEIHQVQTEDGYILTLHRIPHGVNNNNSEKSRPVVLLMHGFISSSADFVILGPGKSLALLLADSGYDVWLGNCRGNTWSRKHVKYDPDTQPNLFFNFSWHEIGIYDLPSKIDYILEKTGQKNLFYVGHSQGTTSFFVMTSEKPEYNEKIRMMAALSPIAFIGHLKSPIVRIIADIWPIADNVLKLFNYYDFLPHSEFISALTAQICNTDLEYVNACLWIINLVAGFDWQIESRFATVIFSNYPAGSSLFQGIHYLQLILSDRFAQYDHGLEGNLKKYMQIIPPSYNISQITAPVSLFSGGHDLLASKQDVAITKTLLPNVIYSKEIEAYNHGDMLWASNVNQLVYDDVLRIMSDYLN